ncbi:MAG: endo alpha-1,4 polygalactosaminidase, partial [Candidatus Aminicenantes bacterium]|nr:endo alpha-1,4 polygalactosaminidase [Candidatus Aminicenantes bacterium]
KRRLVLAYLSIGEAENYRWYWQAGWKPGNPSWLGAENPDWKGNYAVSYWASEWQAIVFQYVDAIIAAGFDGVYLDKIDEYEYWEEKG